MKRALLVTMPFGASNRPAIGISLLKAALVRDGLPCDIQYLNLRFAERIGTAWYQQISDLAPYLLGEWVFAADLFGDRIPPPERYFAELLHRTEHAPDDHRHEYEWTELFGPDHAAEVLDHRPLARVRAGRIHHDLPAKHRVAGAGSPPQSAVPTPGDRAWWRQLRGGDGRRPPSSVPVCRLRLLW
jgi:hypothetical protein